MMKTLPRIASPPAANGGLQKIDYSKNTRRALDDEDGDSAKKQKGSRDAAASWTKLPYLASPEGARNEASPQKSANSERLRLPTDTNQALKAEHQNVNKLYDSYARTPRAESTTVHVGSAEAREVRHRKKRRRKHRHHHHHRHRRSSANGAVEGENRKLPENSDDSTERDRHHRHHRRRHHHRRSNGQVTTTTTTSSTSDGEKDLLRKNERIHDQGNVETDTKDHDKDRHVVSSKLHDKDGKVSSFKLYDKDGKLSSQKLHDKENKRGSQELHGESRNVPQQGHDIRAAASAIAAAGLDETIREVKKAEPQIKHGKATGEKHVPYKLDRQHKPSNAAQQDTMRPIKRQVQVTAPRTLSTIKVEGRNSFPKPKTAESRRDLRSILAGEKASSKKDCARVKISEEPKRLKTNPERRHRDKTVSGASEVARPKTETEARMKGRKEVELMPRSKTFVERQAVVVQPKQHKLVLNNDREANRYQQMINVYLDEKWHRARKQRFFSMLEQFQVKHNNEKVHRSKARARETRNALLRQNEQLDYVRKKHLAQKERRLATQHVKWKFVRKSVDEGQKFGLPNKLNEVDCTKTEEELIKASRAKRRFSKSELRRRNEARFEFMFEPISGRRYVTAVPHVRS